MHYNCLATTASVLGHGISSRPRHRRNLSYVAAPATSAAACDRYSPPAAVCQRAMGQGERRSPFKDLNTPVLFKPEGFGARLTADDSFFEDSVPVSSSAHLDENGNGLEAKDIDQSLGPRPSPLAPRPSPLAPRP